MKIFHTSCDIHPIFLHAVTFLHVLHLDILRRQIKIETESKNKNFLMYRYNAGPPMTIPIYTVLLYCVIKSCSLLRCQSWTLPTLPPSVYSVDIGKSLVSGVVCGL